MYNDLEKVEVNFPDAIFEKRFYGLGGYRLSIPGAYKHVIKRVPDKMTLRANACLSDVGLQKRYSWFLEPLIVKGKSPDVCATRVLNSIRDEDVNRHLDFDDDNHTPQDRKSYFPVYESDAFHVHGDPDFLDFSEIFYKPELTPSSIEDVLAGHLERFFNGATNGPESFLCHVNDVVVNFEPEEVVSFGLNYDANHSHMISAEILADRLER